MRVFLLWFTVVSGVAAIIVALLMPSHLRAVDPNVLSRLGEEGDSLVQAASETAAQNPAIAKILLTAAEELQLAGTEEVIDQLRTDASTRNRSRTLLEQLEAKESGRIQIAETTVLTALRRTSNRQSLSESLQSVEAKQVLRNLELTNLTLFAPSRSAAGLPLEVSVLTAAFLLEQRAFVPTQPLRDEILRLAAGGGRNLEELYLSVFALAKRLSSEQLIAFIGTVPNSRSLHTLTRYMQEHADATSLVYCSAVLSKDGGAVAAYLDRFAMTGQSDLAFALSSGLRALDEVLTRQQPVYRSSFFNFVTGGARMRSVLSPLIRFGAESPRLALMLKIGLLALGGFLVAYSFRFRKEPDEEEQLVLFPAFAIARRAMFATVFVVLAIVLGEPYLAQGEQRVPEVRWSSPIFGAAATSDPIVNAQTSSSMVDQHTILAIVTFLVLQALIYAVCLVKLAEIRKQPVSSALKLKLIENEDNLFDGGLYCGLFGTAASLILLTLGVIKPSLVSAYSSTLFGILFVAILRIGHVRPYRRSLLLEIPEPEEAPATVSRNPFA